MSLKIDKQKEIGLADKHEKIIPNTNKSGSKADKTFSSKLGNKTNTTTKLKDTKSTKLKDTTAAKLKDTTAAKDEIAETAETAETKSKKSSTSGLNEAEILYKFMDK